MAFTYQFSIFIDLNLDFDLLPSIQNLEHRRPLCRTFRSGLTALGSRREGHRPAAGSSESALHVPLSWRRWRRIRVGVQRGYPHHCDSQGTPSLLPSIFVFGQLRMKNVASSQERICEQCWRPSQLKVWTGAAGVRVAAGIVAAGGSAGAAASGARKCR